MSDVVELRAGAARATVHPLDGGRLGQIVIGQRKLLRGPEDGARELGWGHWGAYPLLPWSNRIPGGRFRFEGRDLEVPVNWDDGTALHGLAAWVPWDLEDVGARHATCSVTLEVGAFHVRGLQRFALFDDHLELELVLTNLGDERIPVGLGIHPWFARGPIEVPADLVWPGEPMPVGVPRPVRPDEDLRVLGPPGLMDRCYTGLTGPSARVPGASLSWSDEVSQVVVYTGHPDWVCVEPVTMANDGFRLFDDGVSGSGVIALDPGAGTHVAYRLDWSAD